MQEDSATHLYESNTSGLLALAYIQSAVLSVCHENRNNQGELILPLGTLDDLQQAQRYLKEHLGPAVLEAAEAINKQQSKQRQTLDGVCDLILSKND